jgi:hypothetical protein
MSKKAIKLESVNVYMNILILPPLPPIPHLASPLH